MKADRNSKRSIRKRQRQLIRKGPKSACFVYGLKGEAGEIVYVGQTRTALATRLNFHMRSASPTGSPIQRWLVDHRPEIVMLDNKATWDVCEILWIDRLRREGEPLMNVTRGGKDNVRLAA